MKKERYCTEEKWEVCGKVVTGAANKCPICAVTGTLEARF